MMHTYRMIEAQVHESNDKMKRLKILNVKRLD